MAGQATVFQGSVPLTVAHLTHHDMKADEPGTAPEVFPFGERYGILAVPCGDPGGRMRGGSGSDGDGHRRTRPWTQRGHLTHGR
jgi:hypothetical protein